MPCPFRDQAAIDVPPASPFGNVGNPAPPKPPVTPPTRTKPCLSFDAVTRAVESALARRARRRQLKKGMKVATAMAKDPTLSTDEVAAYINWLVAANLGKGTELPLPPILLSTAYRSKSLHRSKAQTSPAAFQPEMLEGGDNARLAPAPGAPKTGCDEGDGGDEFCTLVLGDEDEVFDLAPDNAVHQNPPPKTDPTSLGNTATSPAHMQQFVAAMAPLLRTMHLHAATCASGSLNNGAGSNMAPSDEFQLRSRQPMSRTAGGSMARRADRFSGFNWADPHDDIVLFEVIDAGNRTEFC